mmetsp:Transcript_88253/g.252336  ORF Transcript_88253/g.252336 Transcript_88253/m.252336 type:complete len:150 (+) Transcript_88253:664-1113(+)
MVLCRAKLCSRLPCNLPSDLLTTHNAPLTTYYPSPATRCPLLRSYMTSAPVFQMVWKGKGAVEAGRAILGETNPLASPAGTVRGDFGVDVGRNLCHGSDSAEAAEKEIAMWFSEDQIVEWSPKMAALVVEDVDDECVLFVSWRVGVLAI